MTRMESYQLVTSRMLGAYIRERRQEPSRNLTQASLAAQLEISAQFLGKIEKGETPMPEDLQAKVMAVLKIPATVIKDIYRDAAMEKAKTIVKKADSFKVKLK